MSSALREACEVASRASQIACDEIEAEEAKLAYERSQLEQSFRDLAKEKREFEKAKAAAIPAPVADSKPAIPDIGNAQAGGGVA